MRIVQRPYNLLLLTGILLVVTSFFLLDGNTSINLQFYDTYYVIAHAHVFWLLAVESLIFWVIYLLTEKLLYSKTLSWLHIIITILTLLILAVSFYIKQRQSTLTLRGYYDFSDRDSFMKLEKYDRILFISIGFILIRQLLYIFNFSIGLFKRKV